MTVFNLSLQTRELTGKQAETLRLEGKIPGILYGHGIENKNIAINYQDFQKVYQQAGESSLIDITVDGGDKVKALIKEVQLNPTTNQFMHIDLLQVKMDEKIKAEVELKFVGESPAVKNFGAILVTNKDSVEVECLPNDLVHEIEVDISGLAEFDNAIHISDIKVPAGVTVLDPGDEVLVLVQAPRTQEELDSLEAKPETPAAAEVATEEKKDETGESEKEAD